MELALQRTGDHQVVTIDRNLSHGCDENGLVPPHNGRGRVILHRLGLPVLISMQDLQH